MLTLCPSMLCMLGKHHLTVHRDLRTLTSIRATCNDPSPCGFGSFQESLSEDSSLGTTVVTLTASDADSSSNNNNVFEYSSVSSVPFTVGVSNGKITTNAALDRETTARLVHLIPLYVD